MPLINRPSGPIFVTACMLGAILLMIAGCAHTGEPLTTESVEPFPPESIEPFPELDFDFSAERHTRTINLFGRETRSIVWIHRSDLMVRYEHLNVNPPEISIFDYRKKKEYRIYEGDHIYFEVDVSDRIYSKAQREGLITRERHPNIEVRRLSLGEGWVEGHPCDLILQVRTLKGAPRWKAEYTLFWEALDLNRQPLQVAYHQTRQIFVVIEYRNARGGPVDPTLLRIPEGYLSITPY